MSVSAPSAREYWRGVLEAGGFTALPRWAPAPVSRTDELTVTVPEQTLAGLHRLAGGGPAPAGGAATGGGATGAVAVAVLSAHAAVLAALTGDREVLTGYRAVPGGPVLPCRLDTGVRSWRALLAGTHRAVTELLVHRHFPVEQLRREQAPGADGGSGPAGSDAVFDPFGGPASDPVDPAVLRVELVDPATGGTGPRLRLRYHAGALDAEAATRIAGYHLSALRLIATDPDADPATARLLSPAERDHQLDGLAGPRRALPDARFHELFERRVAAHPDAVAAVSGAGQWSYRELDQRANQLARALLARGLAAEGVVAVVTERTLDWMACVLAVFKAGGVYLPIEPHFPAGRIAAVLRRAGCRLALTEPGSCATLTAALAELPPGAVETLDIERAYAEGHDRGDLGIAVAPDQLAYIYFTSGSTGEPKGAMCEHAGMLNHLLAKIEDLGIGEGDVVAQTAPQCFDISLWQLVSALLVGGRTVLVEQPVILDVARFVDTVARARVGVLQLVPSYLEAVLSQLESTPRGGPHCLPELRVVSATGEALKKELVARWFAAMPGTCLVNAYGLTETSDDTNHEVMTRVPDSTSVPLGRAVRNVRVYVLDEHLEPVPLGAPGLIAFSGVCVGRGYVNDPDRTAAAYLTDPHHPGERLYLGGDYGRWRPGGTLEFRGRRDSQVKIRGFRIEIGEIENTLLRAPGVRDAAVVVHAPPGEDPRLVAFHSADRPLEVDELRAWLARALPEYMVPSAFHQRDALPLTANSKIDKTVLTAAAAELARTGTGVGGVTGPAGRRAPRTPSEQRLARAWATVLGVPVEEIGRDDHFFERGGSSLSAVKLAVTLQRAVSLTDITRHPVLAELAPLLDPTEPAATGTTPTDTPTAAPGAVLRR